MRISRGDPPSAANERPRDRSTTIDVPVASTVRAATARSQVAPRPNVSCFAPARARRARRSGSSPLATATRRAASSRAPSSSAIAATEPSFSECSMSTFTTTATEGRAMRPSSAISPGTLVPHSSTIARCSGVRVNRVIGTPTRLLRFPAVTRVCPKSARTAAAASVLVVVLPAEPPIARTGSGRLRVSRSTKWRARSPSATRVSATSMRGPVTPRSPATRFTAPRARAPPAKR